VIAYLPTLVERTVRRRLQFSRDDVADAVSSGR
jgi:hypothetical protein